MKYIFTLSLILLFSACSNQVNVILLPQENNKVGKIEIIENSKTITVDKAWQKVDPINNKSEIVDKDEILKEFKNEINSLPKKPKSYILYFKWDSSELTYKSNKQLSQLLNDVKNSNISYINIIGHTDTAGDEKYNEILSLRRAKAIERILIKNRINKDIIELYYYGEAVPIVETKDGVAKSINRRVEVVIK